LSEKKPAKGNCFTYRYDGIIRALITPAKIESAKNKLGIIDITALWDTGASFSLINQGVASKLNLQYISKTYLSTPHRIKIF
jgi:hypothetical protein